jgi:hypothetical protein
MSFKGRDKHSMKKRMRKTKGLSQVYTSKSRHKSSTKQVRELSRKPKRLSIDDHKTWHMHWRAHNQPWRIEPEIDTKRQAFLTQRRTITPDVSKGIYPFKDIALSRADVEWLLATHENG